MRWSAALLSWVAAPALAVEVATPDPQIAVDPGGAVAVGFVVRSDDPVAVSPTWRVPDGWTVTLPDGPFSAGPDPQVRLLLVEVPRTALPGDHRVSYQAGDAGAEVVLSVPARVDLRATLVAEAVTSRRAVLDLVVTNHGNTAVDAGLALDVTGGVATGRPRRRVEVAPHATAHERIVVVPQAGATRISVRSTLADPDGVQLARAVAEVPAPSGRRHLPVSVTGWGVAGTAADGALGAGGQLQVSGAGPLDHEQRWTTAFDLRGPYVEAVRSAAREERARVVVERRHPGGHVRLVAGDDAYPLSPLTERGRYGRGLALELSSDGVEAGLQASVPRYRPDQPLQVGAWTRGGWRGARFGLNTLYTQEPTTPALIVSHDGALGTDRVGARYEVAWGGGPAAMVQARAIGPHAGVWAHAVSAAVDYTGEFRGRTVLSAGGTARLGPLDLAPYAELDRTSVFAGALVPDSTRVGVRAGLPGAVLEWHHRDRRSAADERQADDDVFLTLRRTGRAVDLRGVAGVRTRDPLGDDARATGVLAEVSLDGGTRWRTGVSGRFDTNPGVSTTSHPQGQIRLWTSWRQGGSELRATWLSVASLGASAATHSLWLDAALRMPAAHRLHLRTRLTLRPGVDNATDTETWLGYEIPFRVPLGRRPGQDALVLGEVQLTVLGYTADSRYLVDRVELAPPTPLAGQVVALTSGGRRVWVVTDAHGRASTRLVPGVWTVAPVGVPPGYEAAPVEVSVVAGARAGAEIEVRPTLRRVQLVEPGAAAVRAPAADQVVALDVPAGPIVVRVGDVTELTAVARTRDGAGAQVAAQVVWVVRDPTVAVVEQGRLRGVAPGRTQVMAQQGGARSRAIAVQVVARAASDGD